MAIIRIHTGPDDKSHFEDVEPRLEPRDAQQGRDPDRRTGAMIRRLAAVILLGSLWLHSGPGDAQVQYFDTHNHAPTTPTCTYDNDYDAQVNGVVDAMDKAGIDVTLFMPPPHGLENLPTCDYQHLPVIAQQHPDRFAFLLGGETLNLMIQEVVQDPTTLPAIQPLFEQRARDILGAGAVGFGELAAEHFSLHEGHPYISAPPDHPLFLLLAYIAATYNVPIDLHMEAVAQDTPIANLPTCSEAYGRGSPNPVTFSANIAALERLLQYGAPIVWAHAGWDNTGDRTPDLTRDLLQQHPNLYIQLRPLPQKSAACNPLLLDDQGTIDPDWRALIADFPDRFVVGMDSFYSDFIMPPRDPSVWAAQLEGLLRAGKLFMSKLHEFSPALARKVGVTNAICLYGLTPRIRFGAADYGVNEGAESAEITVELMGCPEGEVTVEFSTSDGTASAGADYQATSGTLTFAPGEVGKTFKVPIIADAVVEDNETVNLTLSNPTGAVLGTPATAVLTIANEDVSFRFVDASYTVSEAGGTATIRVEKLGGTPGTVSVDFATSDGMAKTLTFAPGDPGIQAFTIPILNNTIPEAHKTVNLTLSNPTNPDGAATLATPSTVVLTILNDDVAFRFRSAAYSVRESGGTAIIEVERLGEIPNSASVDVVIGGGTAIPGVDYVATTGPLTFNPGDPAVKTFVVTILDNTVPGPHKTVGFALANPRNPGGTAALETPSATLLTILNDDVAFRFTSASYRVAENATAALITVERLGAVPLGVSVSVDYGTTGGGTATAGVDYLPASGTLTFGPGQRFQKFAVTIIDDLHPEDDETVNLRLMDPRNPAGTAALATPNTAVLTILNDDVVFHFRRGAYVVHESGGLATVEVDRLGAAVNSVAVDYSTSDDSAVAGSDYVAASGTLTFAPGEMSKSFMVTIVNNTVSDGSRAATLTLSSPSNPGGTARLGAPGTARLMILDDDLGGPR